MQEIVIKLQPKQKQFKSAVDNAPIVFYGGARGGGKSYGLRNIILLRRFEYPKTKGAIFRQSYPELESNHIRPLFDEHPCLQQYWNDSKKILNLPNGSTLQFSHCSNEKDVSLYQGREIEDLGIDEVGSWTEAMFRRLLGSNRSSRPGIKPRCLLTGNPGGIGHQWLKRLFIDKKYKPNERPTDYTFVLAKVYDNAALINNDPDYISRLQSETNPTLRKAYLDGNWDLLAGAYFTELSREAHFIKPFSIPKHWNKFGAYDFGFNHPAAFGWFAVDGDGNVYLYREFAKAGLRIDEFAQEINRHDDTKDLQYIKAGLDCWAQKGVINKIQPPTIAEEFSKHNIILTRASIDRIQGANQIRAHLALRPKPRFFIMESCPLSYEALARMIHDPDRPEDILKVDAVNGDPETGDDLVDMIRYGLMSRPSLAKELPVNLKPQSKEWLDYQAKRHEQIIEDQIENEQREQRELDQMAISMLDPEDNPINYYINKRKNG